jgi:hypothetical protein
MDSDMIVFGDLHSKPDALETILGHAEQNNISVALNLGDENHLYGDECELEKVYELLRNWRDASSRRRLICVASDRTDDVISTLCRNYVGMNKRGEIKGKSIFKEGNILAAHEGKDILEEYGDFIKNYHAREPLMIFHGHLHSMNVCGEYRWLNDNEKIRFIKEGEKHWKLRNRTVYWVSPGKAGWPGNDEYGYGSTEVANFALYHPKDKKLTLKSVSLPKSQ